MSNKIFRMAFPLACGWTPATTLRIGMKRVLGGLLALALPLLLAMPPVSAASTLRFDDGFNMLDFDDNGGDDTDSTVGIIDPGVRGLGVFTFIDVIGTHPPIPAIPSNPIMTLSGRVGSRAPGMLAVLITQTDFTGLLPLFGDIFGNVLVGPGNNVTYTAYADASNNKFGKSTIIGTTGPIVTVGTSPFAGIGVKLSGVFFHHGHLDIEHGVALGFKAFEGSHA